MQTKPLGTTAERVLRLSREGYNQPEIAALCGITQQRVSALQSQLRKRGLSLEPKEEE